MDNHSSAGWQNSKSEEMYTTDETPHFHQMKNDTTITPYIFTNFETNDSSKLEEFFYGHDQANSLTEVIHTGHSDLDMVSTLQAMSSNSRCYDHDQFHDSDSVRQSQLVHGGQSTESAGNELVVYDMSVGNYEKPEKEIVRNGADSCKKIGATADTFSHRTSIYRGVTRHRWTGRYEAHLWDNSCTREGQARKGRQVYLGGYEKEDKAAIAYDLAALKYWGPTATTNFPVSNYTNELEMMKNFTKQEFIASLRRKSSGFSRGASIYRGVTRHHQQGRWQARIGRVAGNKDLYLGTFATEEEAAEAYDIAAIKFRGENAVTNFELNQYDVEAIAKSSLPVGASKRLKLSLQEEKKPSLVDTLDQQSNINNGSILTFDTSTVLVPANPHIAPFDSTIPNYHQNLLHQIHSSNATTFNAPGSMSTAVTSVQLLSPPADIFGWPHYSC